MQLTSKGLDSLPSGNSGFGPARANVAVCWEPTTPAPDTSPNHLVSVTAGSRNENAMNHPTTANTAWGLQHYWFRDRRQTHRLTFMSS